MLTAEYKSLLKLGFPVLLTQIGIIVVSFADTIMVGAYGTDELGAAAFVNNFFMVPTVMLIGFASGLTPLVGALYSRAKNHDAGRTLRAGLRINLFVAGALTLILGALWFSLDYLGQPPELLPLIKDYYLIILASLIPMSIFNACQQMANGVTDTALPMWIILSANVLNIFGNYVLIFGKLGFPELGLVGAGLSTLFARVFGCVVIMIVILRSKRYRCYGEGLRERGGTHAEGRRVWSTSYPLMIQSGVECFLWAFGAVVCGWFGKIELASYQVVNTMAQLGFMTYMSFGVAVSIRVSNHMGVRDFDGIRRVTKAGLHLILALGTAASLVFLVWGRAIIGLFTPDEEVIACSVTLILPLILYQYGDATQLTYVNAQRGTGFVKPLLWISLIAYIAVGVPLLLLMAWKMELGALGAYYSFSGALFAAAAMLMACFRRTLRRCRAQDGQ